ncbi:hypothetical protein [Phytohabitans kaempferiae]|uniref:Lipoprotein LpqB beta-propeller domain-containing protein n=1 Tax=Phytohabitans kaempferiae TaxID=1620943 RepID=A0ABV6M9B1_9ACTN
MADDSTRQHGMRELMGRRNVRIWIAVAAGVVVIAALGGLAVYKRPGGDCTVERLALPSPDAYSVVFAMEPGGRHIVGRTGSIGRTGSVDLDLLIWTDGRPRLVDLPGESQLPHDVNAAGVVVGSTVFGAMGGPQEIRAWVYRDGAVAILPGTRGTEAFAVSDDGTVVGTVEGRPVLWDPSANKPSSLRMPEAGWKGKAIDISADGQTIVGQLTPDVKSRPYVWSADGTPRELPLPTIDGETAMTASAKSITGEWVAGLATSRHDDGGVPVRWNLRTGEVRVFPKYGLVGASVSTDGRITAKGDGGRAVVLGGRNTLTLRRLDDNTGLHDTTYGISYDGRTIAGNAASARSGTAPVVWHCT